MPWTALFGLCPHPSVSPVLPLDHGTSAMSRGHGILRLWLHWDGATWAVGESLAPQAHPPEN